MAGNLHVGVTSPVVSVMTSKTSPTTIPLTPKLSTPEITTCVYEVKSRVGMPSGGTGWVMFSGGGVVVTISRDWEVLSLGKLQEIKMG